MPACIMQSCQLLVCEKKRESHTIMYQPPYLAYLKILHLLDQSNVFVLQHSSLFIYLQSNTYVVGTCNHTDVEKPNHPSMGPTHTPTILLCTFKVFHAFPPVHQTWTTMTWLPSPCRLGDMVWPSPAAWQVRSAQRHFGHQRDLASRGNNSTPDHHWQQLQALSSLYTSSTTTTINTLPGADCAVIAEEMKAVRNGSTTAQWSGESQSFELVG
jgi:hypothetical protein